MRTTRLIVSALLLVLLVSTIACGGGGDEATPTPTPTVTRLIEVQSYHWGKGHGSMSIGGEVISERDFLFVDGSARNVGSETLTSVIVVMNCWSGQTLVKSEEDVIGLKFEEVDLIIYDQIVPGGSFDFEVQTAYDPSIDNVTVEFKDSSGQTIPQR